MEEKYVKYGKSVTVTIAVVAILLCGVLLLDSRIDDNNVSQGANLSDNDSDSLNVTLVTLSDEIGNVSLDHSVNVTDIINESENTIENISLNNESILNESIE